MDARPMALIMTLALAALALVFTMWDLQPPTPKNAQAPPGEFSAGRALVVLQDLLAGGEPHPVGSEANDRVRERIVARLRALGYEADVQETIVSRGRTGALTTCARVRNVVARLPGRDPAGGPAVMVVTHYDSAGAGPGASDDTASVAAILEIAGIMKEQEPYRNPVLFVLTDGEEIGLMGAQAFVEEHPWARDVRVAVNLEARGTTGLSFMFETSENNAWLLDAYAASVPRPVANSLSYEVYKLLPNDTDLTVFRAAGMAGLNFAFIENAHYYHTSGDSLENLNPGSLQHQGECVLAVVRQLAETDLSSPPAGNAVYMTVPPGLYVVRWPTPWTLPLAVLLALALLTLAAWLAHWGRGELRVREIFWGFLVALLTVVLPVLLGLGLTLAVSTIAGTSAPWYAYPLPMRASLWAGALFCGGLAAAGLARRAGLWGLGLGAWLLWALLALLLSFTLPGIAILFMMPLFCAVVLVAVVALVRRSRSALAVEVAFVIAALAAGLVWMPLALVLEFAMGLEMSPIVTLPAGLIASALLPLFALPQGRTRVRRWLIAAATTVVVLGAAVTPFLPTYSPAVPQPVNVYHFEDQDAGTAYWVADTYRGEVPDPLRRQLDGEPRAVLPWSSSEYLVATAPAADASAPDLDVLSDEQTGGERVVRVQLRAPEGANRVDLLVPMENLNSGSVAGDTFQVNSEDAWRSYYSLWCYGLGAEGVEITLRLGSTGPVEVLLVSTSPGLPPTGAHLIQARPATAVPARGGDTTMVLRRVRL